MTMKLRTFLLTLCLVLVAPAILGATPALAKDDHGKGKGKDHGHSREGGRDEGPGGGPYVNVNINFVDVDRRAVYDYYGDVARHGKCPPGLAKKHNGCLPPGLARKWYVGRPLPREVIYYPLPPELVVRIAPPPPGYRYVRVASDVLLIAAGTGMVAAAIEDLGRF